MLSLKDGILTDYTLNGQKYPLNMAYNNVLSWYALINRDDLNDEQKARQTLKMFTGLNVASIEVAAAFFHDLADYLAQEPYNHGEQPTGTTHDLAGTEYEAPKLYDYEQDSEAIFASFWQAYGIDLIEQRDKLHWDKFKALLSGLPSNSYFKTILDVRQRDTAGLEGKELNELLEAKAAVALDGQETKTKNNAAKLDDAFSALAGDRSD